MIEDVRDGVAVLRFERPACVRSLRHIVTTRRGKDGDEFRGDLLRPEDRRRLAELLGDRTLPIVFVNQVHGDRVLAVNADTGDGCAGDADGLVTDDGRIALAVKGADCPLVLLHDPVQGALGLFHSGWRGTVGHIARAAVAAMRDSFRSDPSQIGAAIAPSVRSCCYRVGPEVADAFRRAFPEDFLYYRLGHTHLNLQAAIRFDLVHAGLDPRNIEESPLCTVCRQDLFHSYRRDGARAGRILLLACLS